MHHDTIKLIDKLLVNAFEEHQLELEFAEFLRELPSEARDKLAEIMHIRAMIVSEAMGTDLSPPSKDAMIAYVMERGEWADDHLTHEMLLNRGVAFEDEFDLLYDEMIDDLDDEESE